jgi:RNA polymerase sigma-70 factor (ECF subfamily)
MVVTSAKSPTVGQNGHETVCSKWTDEELLLRYRDSGQTAPFNELVDRYEREIFCYLSRFFCDAGLAEDVLQDTFLQVHLKRGQFEAGRKFRPWLYAIAKYKAIDLQRRNKRRRMVSLDVPGHCNRQDFNSPINLVQSNQPDPAALAEGTENRRRIRQTVAGLPRKYRSPVILVYYQGLKYREAAEALSLPIGTIKSRLHAALMKLNKTWRRENRQQGQSPTKSANQPRRGYAHSAQSVNGRSQNDFGLTKQNRLSRENQTRTT